MYYIAIGLQSYQIKRPINKYVIISVLTLLCLLSYTTGLKQIIHNQSQTLEGPQEAEAVEAFEYIKTHTKSNDTILFIKPRALALYTGRFSYSNHKEQDSASLVKKITSSNTKFFLLTSDLNNPSLNNFILSKKDSVEVKFKNAKFEFYQLKK